MPSRIWGGYSGGPCPNVGLNGTGINYSYGDNTLSQTLAVNQALANAGSNLQVNGYNYSWQVKNSNINNAQPGGYDPIATITVNLLDKSKAVLASDVYDYGYRLANWTTFSGTRTYNNPYGIDTLGSIGIAVRSKDSGYWAGYYGPEFQNFRLSLNYSVVQAVAPPVVAPTTVPTVSSVSIPTTVTKTVVAAASSADPTSSPVTNVNVGGVELSSSGTLSAPDGIPQTVKDVVATVQAPATTTVATASNTETSAAASTAKSESKQGAPMSLIMSTISKIQENDKATQKAAVQNASQQVALSVSKSQEQAASVVSSLNSMSEASSQSSSQTTTQQTNQQVTQSISMPGQQVTQSVSSQQQQQTTQQITQQVVNINSTIVNSSASIVNSSAQSAPVIISSAPMTQGRTVSTYTAPNMQSMGVSYTLFTQPMIPTAQVQPTYSPPSNISGDVPVLQTNTSMSRTNPLAEMMESRNLFSTNQVEQKQETVNRNVQMNELAGGVDIASIANIPKGYDVYTTISLVDAKFYKLEEIYKNQNNTDNVRVLRGLTGGSDRLHQEMIDQQFKLGK